MAQSTTAPRNDATISITPEAWAAMARTRKVDVDEDNNVLGYTDGRILKIAPPRTLAEVFAAVVQYRLTRVGQTAKGNIQDAMDAAANNGDISDAKGYGAREQAYRAAILDLIVTKVDPNFTLTVKGDPAKTAENRKNFEATVESQRAARFDKIVTAARANVMRAAGDKPTTRKAAPKGTAFEIGALDDAAE
jgi:hypothetical protein